MHIVEVINLLRVDWPRGMAGPPREPLRSAVCTVWPPAAGQVEGSGLLVADTSAGANQFAFAIDQLGAALVTAAPPVADGQPQLLHGVHTHIRRARG